MKSILKITILLSAQILNAQCWNNTALPPIDNNWSWRHTDISNYPVYFGTGMLAPPAPPSTYTEMPWYRQNPGNINAGNTNLSVLVPTPYDFKPEDGWVLLGKAFGTPTLGAVIGQKVSNPYFIIYNKFTGRMKVFHGNPALNLPGQFAYLTSDFYDDRTNPNKSIKTALFGFNEPIAKTLKYFNDALNVNSINKHVLQGNTGGIVSSDVFWYYSDYVTAYDPCGCRMLDEGKSSSLLFSQTLDNTSTIEADIHGTISTAVSGGSASNQMTFSNSVKGASSGYSTFSGYASTAATVLTKIHDFHKERMIKDYWMTTDEFKNNQSKTDAEKKQLFEDFFKSPKGIEKSTGLGNDGFFNALKKGASALPYVGTVLGFFNMLSGGSAPVTSFEANLKLMGTLTTLQPNGTIELTTPGLRNTPAAAGAMQPNYDNTLGVFNMIEPPAFEYAEIKPTAPVIDRNNLNLSCCDNNLNLLYSPHVQNNVLRQYKIKTPPKLVINPYSELELDYVDAAIVLDYGDADLGYPQTGKSWWHTGSSSFPPGFITQSGPSIQLFSSIMKIPFHQDIFTIKTTKDRIQNIEDSKELVLENISKTYQDNNSNTEGTIRFRTPYVSLQCVDQLNFTLLGGGADPKVYIKTFVRLKHKTDPSKNYTQVITFDASDTFKKAVKSVSIGSYVPNLKLRVCRERCWTNGSCLEYTCDNIDYTSFGSITRPWVNPFDKVLDGSKNPITVNNSNFGTGSILYVNGNAIINTNITGLTIYATGSITINAGITAMNCKFYCENVDRKPPFVLDPSSIVDGTPVSLADFIGCTKPSSDALATEAEITSLCTSNSYKTKAGFFKSASDITPSKSKSDFSTTFTLQPNPASDYTKLEIDQPVGDRAIVKVYDMVGREVYSQEMLELDKGKTSLEISTQEFHRGIYIVKIIHGEVEKSLKLEVTK